MKASDEHDDEIVRFIARKVIENLLKNPDISREKITSLKGRISKQFNYNKVIKNAQILEYATDEEKKQINALLKRRVTRTISGVSVIAIMTEPLPCPGECIYCPGLDSQPGKKVAQSYTGQEPAALRSIHNEYDAFRQVQSRIKDLEAIGHWVDKIELLVMGGTFLSCPSEYQERFIKGAYEGVIGQKTDTLKRVKTLAERSNKRLIGLTIETRPDYCKETHVDRMLDYGATRVEIGIQTIYDDIYDITQRGHTAEDSMEAIRIARDAGLKINAHVMPNLPGSNYTRDAEMFKGLYSNPNYRPDMLKIYPCLVIKGTELYDWWKDGRYQPYSEDQLIDLLANVKQNLPSYVRIQRIMRDIPAPLIEAGSKKSNLRQLIQEKLASMNAKCNCIRCREYGLTKMKESMINDSLEDVHLLRLNYDASEGQEIFLSLENKVENYLVGYLRLRKPSEFAHRTEVNDGKTLIVREIRIVGELVPKDSKPNRIQQIQHRGFGTLLLNTAENIASEEFDAEKLAVISGVGARDWFYEMEYVLDGPYVSRKL